MFTKLMEKKMKSFAMMSCPYCGFNHKQNIDKAVTFFNTSKGVCGLALKDKFNLVYCHDCRKPFVVFQQAKQKLIDGISVQATFITSLKIEGFEDVEFPELISIESE